MVVAPTSARVLHVGTDSWVRVLRIDGISEDADCELSHAWIPVDDVVMQR